MSEFFEDKSVNANRTDIVKLNKSDFLKKEVEEFG